MIKKFCCISDTHGVHRSLDIEPCDFIIHSGDILRKYKLEDIQDFIDWFSSVPAVHKVLVAGNHDRFIAREKQTFLKLIEGKIFYLENSGIEIEGIRFWGSPSVKWCGPYKHFTYQNEAEAEGIFSLIPENIDILITHGPPYGILDSEGGWDGITHHGSKSLLKIVLSIKPRYHIFGHVHKDYGKFKNEHTVFINSCIVNNNETIVNMHNTFDFDTENGIVKF